MKNIDIENIKLSFLQLEQPSGIMYMGILRANEVDAISRVNRLSEESHKDENIQRNENRRRIKEISAYAETANAIFPTPIILSGKSDFVKVDFEKNVMSFNKNAAKSFSIIDGQHRLLGIKESNVFESLSLPVVICLDTEPYEDAMIFITINGNQVKVPSSIIYQLFDIMPNRSVEKTCHTIAQVSNNDKDSPFYNRIKMLGTKALDQDFAPLTQSSFITPLKQMFSESGIFYDFYQQDKDDVIYKILYNYFKAVSRVFEKDWNDKYSLLPKAIGHKALLELFQNRIFPMGKNKGELTENFFYNTLKPLGKVYSGKMDSSHYGSSYGGANKLYKDLLKVIDNI